MLLRVRDNSLIRGPVCKGVRLERCAQDNSPVRIVPQVTLSLGVVLNLLKFYSIYSRESHDPISNLEKEITLVVPIERA